MNPATCQSIYVGILRSPNWSASFYKKTIFKSSPEKQFLIIRIPAGFTGIGWGKLSDEKSRDKNPFGGFLWRLFPPVFWQTERKLSAFSTGTEMWDLSGVSAGIGMPWGKKEPVQGLFDLRGGTPDSGGLPQRTNGGLVFSHPHPGKNYLPIRIPAGFLGSG